MSKRSRSCAIHACVNYTGSRSLEIIFFRYDSNEKLIWNVFPKNVVRAQIINWISLGNKRSRITPNIYFLYSVPKEGALREKWIEEIEMHQCFEQISSYVNICSLHFDSSCITKNRKLKLGSIPTIFASDNSHVDENVES